MGVLADIKDLLKTVASNQRVAKWFVIILIVVCGAAFFYYKNIYRPKPESDCTFIKQQNKELLAFILEAKKQVEQLAQPTSYLPKGSSFIFASYDTIPKPKTAQQKLTVLLSKFDSVLNKAKEDAIKQRKKN